MDAFPMASDRASWKVVERIEHNGDSRQRIKVTTDELLQQRELVLELVRR
jgi:hypothetical protein